MSAARTLLVLVTVGALGACTGGSDDDNSGSTTTLTADEPPTTSTGDGSVASTTTEPPVVELGPLGETEVDLETDEGRVQIGDAQLPDSLPDDFPLPDDLVVQISSEEVADAGFSGASQVGFEELVALYRTGLADAGYEVNEDRFVEGVVAVFSFEGDGGDGSVVIGDAPGGGRSVIVTFET